MLPDKFAEGQNTDVYRDVSCWNMTLINHKSFPVQAVWLLDTKVAVFTACTFFCLEQAFFFFFLVIIAHSDFGKPDEKLQSLHSTVEASQFTLYHG